MENNSIITHILEAEYIKQCFDKEIFWIITFICPFCFDKIKKNGQPYKKAKNRKHTHGLGIEELEKGYMDGRISHCPHMKDYKVNIIEKTQRRYYEPPNSIKKKLFEEYLKSKIKN